MGALAPASSWIPEDDLLLKNAIESGASIESLAKGAVQFSRKFSVRELQERWYSLLYDPVVSKEASCSMIESEQSASTVQSKFNRAGTSKEKQNLPPKRKSEGVRSCYNALCKKLRDEPFNSVELSYLVAPSDTNYIGNEEESGNGMLGGVPIPNRLELQETNTDVMRPTISKSLADDVAATGDDGIAHGFPTLHEQNKEDFSAHPVNIHQDIPHMVGEEHSLVGNGSGIKELDQPEGLPVQSVFDADGLMMKHTTNFDQINCDPDNIYSGFEGNQIFNSPIAECGASFHNLEYSPPLPGMSIWRTDEGLSASVIPVDENLGEKDQLTGDRYTLSGDVGAKDDSASGCEVHTDSGLNSQVQCDKLRSQTATAEGFLAQLNNFLEDESCFMDDHVKDEIDIASLSLLLHSPNDANQDHMPCIAEPETLLTEDHAPNIAGVHLVEVGDSRGSHLGDGPVACNRESLVISSTSTSVSQSKEMTVGIICCTLNTEDTEIPFNDDIVFPDNLFPLSAFSARKSFKEAGSSFPSVKDSSGSQRISEGGSVLMQRDRKDPHAASPIIEPQMMSERGQLHSIGECKSKMEDFSSIASRSRYGSFSCGGSTKNNSINVTVDTVPPSGLRKESRGVIEKHPSLASVDPFEDKPVLRSDSHNNYPQANASGSKQDVDARLMVQGHQASDAEVGMADINSSEQVFNPPVSDLEDLPIGSDDDAPYYSDIEAMILDMDLDPDDQDSYDQEVARYQNEDTKRAIIRLEQGARSYMQRDIASHGAFAIFYGRNSKHYIKKPEVLIGRATQDVIVDIDLGREGRANKISRRQASINMNKDGSFHLKNLGQFPVLVNGKEVRPGQGLSLKPDCLIEIRGMPFIFDTNQRCVKQYLDSKASV